MAEQSLFRKIDGGLSYSDSDYQAVLEHFGCELPSSFEEFLRQHHSSYLVDQTVGYEALECVSVSHPVMMRKWDGVRNWGPEFVPFMEASHAFFAFDLRHSRENPPVVHLDWLDESEFGEPVNYGAVRPIAPTFDEFFDLVSVWKRPPSLPFLTSSYRSLFSRLDVDPEPTIRPLHASEGWRLRSGVVGSEGWRVPSLMGCLEPDAAHEGLINELHTERVYERFVPVVGERFIPFMTGEDGWLALDYRETRVSAPVVFVERDGALPGGRIEPLADSPMGAFALYR